MQNRKRLIVVLGMHRSGTSAITRGLKVLGVELGDCLIPPIENNNERGFWEDAEINALDIEMLSVVGSDWHHMSPLRSLDFHHLYNAGFQQKAADLLNEKMANNSLFGIKDPRIAKLLPFWRDVFEQVQLDINYVIALRHPMSVCESLAKRDRFDFEKGYYLWTEHVISCLEGTQSNNRIVVDYDKLMHMPEMQLRRVAEMFGLGINSNAMSEYMDEFLDEKLRHTQHNLADLHGDQRAPALVKEMYELLLNEADDSAVIGQDEWTGIVSGWRERFNKMMPLLRLSDRLWDRATISEAECAAQSNNLAESHKHIVALTEWATSADAYGKARAAELSELREIYEAERGRTQKYIDGLESTLNAYQRHWIFKIFSRSCLK